MAVGMTDVAERRDLDLARAGFLVVFALGAASILALKALSVSQFIVTAVPVALMLLYAAVLWFSPSVVDTEQQHGDGLYYLGFLFTLTSLAYSLYEFRNHDVDSIITNFGIAVWTTILGMALRVLFQQTRRDVSALEERVRADVAQAAWHLHTQLQDASRTVAEAVGAAHIQLGQLGPDMKAFRDATLKVAAETSAEVTRNALDTIATSSQAHSGAVHELIAVVKESATAMRKHSAQIARGVEAVFSQVSQALETVATGYETSARGFTDGLKLTADDLQTMSSQIRASGEHAAGALDALAGRVDTVDVPSDLLVRKLEDYASSIGDIVARQAERAKADAAHVALVASALEELAKGVRVVDDELHAVKSATEAQRASVNDAMTTLADTLKTVKQTGSDYVREILSNIQVEAAALSALRRTTEEEVATITRYRQTIEKEASEALSAAQQVYQATGSMAQVIVKELHG